MNLVAIKRVVVAALLLPTVVMVCEAGMLIRHYYTDLVTLEVSQQHANLLTIAGEIASARAPEEGEATVAYVQRREEDTLAKMQVARGRLDAQMALLQGLMQNESRIERVIAEKLASLQSATKELQAFRQRVDRMDVPLAEVIAAYRPLSLGYLSLVEVLDEQISDSRLRRRLGDLHAMLHGNEAGLVVGLIGSEYLSTGSLTPQQSEVFEEAAARYETYIVELVGHGGADEHPWVLSFDRSGNGSLFRDSVAHILNGDKVIRGLPVPSQEALAAWTELHVLRANLWKQDLAVTIQDIRALGDMLARQSRMHFIGLAAAVLALSLVTMVIVVLAVKGAHFVDRLIRERELLVTELRNASHTDMLTGLSNRRGFEAAILAIETQATEKRRTHSVVVFDLDRFKQVNDVYGHDAGDAVLAVIARVARSNFRPIDLLARHGGEEFVVLLPDSSLEEAASIAERVRKAIAETEIILPNGGPVLHVTASFGCASHEGAFFASGLNEMIKKADLALYAAKFSGRNKVVRDGEFAEISMERREVKFA